MKTLFIFSSILFLFTVGCSSVGEKYLRACEKGDYDKVLGIKSKVDLNATNEDGANGLMSAAYNGNLEIVEYLIEKKIDIGHLDELGNSALFYALYSDNSNVITSISEEMIKSGRMDLVKDFFFYISENRYSNLMRELLSQGVPPTFYGNNGWTPLMNAAWVGDIETSKILIEAGSQIDARSKDDDKTWALMLAVFADHPDVFKLLIDNGADFSLKNSDKETALIQAIKLNRVSILKKMISMGLNVNESYEEIPVLFIAKAMGHNEIVKALLNVGVDTAMILNGKTITYEHFLELSKSYDFDY